MRSNLTKLAILIVISLLWTASSSLASASGPQGIPAFPGAEGGGAWTPGGRGGRVIEVTNLNDTGPGSFRNALEASGPRIIVFRVGGTIELQDRIKVTEPYVTVAGQTAPGDGITLKNHGLRILTHDIIIRYMRFRPGDDSTGDGTEVDGINIGNLPENSNDTDAMVHDIILDHVSVSWAIDKNIGIWNSRPNINNIENITIQWSIISEGLANNRHYEGEHSKGILVGEFSDHISIHHNLFAHNTDRNPKVKGGSAEVINNVIYNSSSAGVTVAGSGTPTDPPQIINYIGNYDISGVNSGNVRNMVIFTNNGDDNDKKDHRIYVQGNIGVTRQNPNQNEWLVVSDQYGDDPDGIPNEWKLSHPYPINGIPVTIQAYQTAYQQILDNAGASLVRDVVDKRIVNDVKNKTGRIIDRPEDVGGYPNLSNGTPPQDSDHDGMPDSWETQQGLNPNNPADGSGDLDGDGYTNVEEYLNGTDNIRQPPPSFNGAHQIFLPGVFKSKPPVNNNTVLTPIEDTFIRNGQYDNDNYGSLDVLQMKNRDNADADRKAYIKFNISSINSVSSAKLRVYGRIQKDSNTLSIHPVDPGAWQEMNLTWKNAPNLDQTILTSINVNNTENQWWEIDLTAYVQSQKASGNSIISLVLYSANEGAPTMYIKSREHNDAPQLIIR
jgi:pectate lyase